MASKPPHHTTRATDCPKCSDIEPITFVSRKIFHTQMIPDTELEIETGDAVGDLVSRRHLDKLCSPS